MLHELRVENLLLIERAELRLTPGLNVLTGETGAGKTVLAHALDLLLGGRARPGIVRPGAEEAYVEGVFDLPDQLRARLGDRIGAEESELVLARRVAADGRTRAYVGRRAATVSELREAAGSLIAFYGQHEHRKLTLSAAQLEIVDGMCGERHRERLRACAQACEEQARLRTRERELAELAAQRDRELDLLAFELDEIDALEPDEAEHERLLAARERLRRVDSLASAAALGAEAIAPEAPGTASPADELAAAATRIDALAGVDPQLDGLGERLHSLLIESRDLARELRDYAAGLALEAGGTVGPGGAPTVADEDAPATLEALEERLAALDRVARKHGGSIAAVLEFAEDARGRRRRLLDVEGDLDGVRAALDGAAAQLQEHVLELRREREAAGERLGRAVIEQLQALAMGEATFRVQLSSSEPGPHGGDAVEFVIAPNPGVPAGPLREIASGGELSRIMLAIMAASSEPAAGSAEAATLVFDEVDAGIGGHTANAVGSRLQALAERHQVLCITHLPQIASLAARHFSVVKDTRAEPTRASVVQLAEREVLAELVRMLGADAGDATARRHARELRRAA
jgi:DNA repair protein RecN (Recombination protein N)